MKKTSAYVISAVVAAVIVVTGCASSNVNLKQNMYAPSFNADEFRDYRGRGVYLPPFVNKADNTTLWFYSSVDKKRKYVMNSVEQFFWNCCQDAFLHVGIFVYESPSVSPAVNPDEKFKQGFKEFRMQLSSLTDMEYRFIVTLYDGRSIVFQRKFIIPMNPPEGEDMAALEKRAYAMVDRSFETILKDQGFRDAFLSDSAPVQDPAKGE